MMDTNKVTELAMELKEHEERRRALRKKIPLTSIEKDIVAAARFRIRECDGEKDFVITKDHAWLWLETIEHLSCIAGV